MSDETTLRDYLVKVWVNVSAESEDDATIIVLKAVKTGLDIASDDWHISDVERVSEE